MQNGAQGAAGQNGLHWFETTCIEMLAVLLHHFCLRKRVSFRRCGRQQYARHVFAVGNPTKSVRVLVTLTEKLGAADLWDLSVNSSSLNMPFFFETRTGGGLMVVVPTARPPPHPGLVTANHTFPTSNITGHISAVQNSQDPGFLAHPQHPLRNTKYIRCLAKQISIELSQQS